ncbi:MAG: heme lyase CcmF/NrfE family subunit [Proteobacteria bacterium]|nr:heme lyase CcmF/NrfE family subunit [Pseudomonadota bacterium]
MGSFGQLVVCISMVLSAAGGALALASGARPEVLNTSRKLLNAAAAGSAASLLVLAFLLLSHDYRIAYIRDYADRTMSVGYLLMAVWGGQQGSLLLWAVLQSWFTAAAANFTNNKNSHLMPIALGFLAALQVFFFSLVLYHSNPFETLGTVASRGIGMNPLLRNPYMAIHPPTLFLGFVGFSVPMAFAFASLVNGLKNDDWLKEMRPWILFAWIFLSIGNLLGMVWAYQELGWGGYWGWDPVENSSFMPWLTGTALVHSALVVRHRKMFRLWSLTLTLLTFILIIFGTFLTRSNIIQSVHAFAGATTGPYFLGLMVSTSILFLFLVILRRSELAGSRSIESVLSPEGVFLAANLVFVLSTAFVWFTTMSPLFAELLKGEKIAVTPEFYNRWMVPLGLFLLGLISLCTIIGWRNQTFRKIGSSALLPITGGVIAALTGSLLGNANSDKGAFFAVAPIVSIGLIGFVATSVIREIVRLTTRAQKSSGLIGAGRRRLGGQLVHLAVALLFVGFTGSAYTVEQSSSLLPGKSMQVGNYTLKFLGIREDNNYERNALFADLEVKTSDETLGVLSPSRHTYHSHPGRPTSEVVIHTGLKEDLFVILGEGDPTRRWAMIRAVVNPLVIWIWLGGSLLVFGALIALIPARWLSTMIRTGGQSKRRLFEATGLSVLTVVITVIVGFLSSLATSVAALAGLSLIWMLILFGNAINDLAAQMEER